MYDNVGITIDMIAPIFPIILIAIVIGLIISIPILILRIKIERKIERKEIERRMRITREIANKIELEEQHKRTNTVRTSNNKNHSKTRK